MKNKYIANILCTFLFLSIFIFPLLALGEEGGKSGGGNGSEPGSGGYSLVQECDTKTGCDWEDFIKLVNRFITLLLYLATLLAVISFVYAGFKLLFSGGNEEAVKDAKKIFGMVVVGLVLAYGAWIIVYFLTSTLGVNDGYTLLK